MSEENEVKPKKRTGLVVFLTILVILLVAALAVFATLYFTGSDFLKFDKEGAKAEVAEEDKEEEETKTSKKSSKTEKEDKKDTKTETDKNVTKDLNSLITGGDKTKNNNTTSTNVSDLAGTTSNTSKVPVSSTVFTTVLAKYGIKCEANVGTTGVNELYIGYSDDQKSSASYIKFDYEEDAAKYYNEQRDKMVTQYGSIGDAKKETGKNWETLKITFPGTTSFIYLAKVDNVLLAISTDDSTVFNSMDAMIRELGY